MTSQPATAETNWDIPADGSTNDDPLLGCLLTLAKIKHKPCTAATLTAGLPLVDHKLTPQLFIRAAQRAGMTARLVNRPLGKISNLVLPAVILLERGRACILDQVTEENTAKIIQPESGAGVRYIELDKLELEYSGYAIFIQSNYQFDERTRDTLISRPQHWFWDTLAESWPVYGEVIIAALLINMFALASPLFIMNVYDRVVPNHATETLWVLGVGVTVVYGFDLLMRTLRGYFIDIAGKRADIEISASLFERVMGIRLDARPPSVGALANSLHEFDTFRDFFTSATLTALIDLPFALLFIMIIALLGGTLAVIPLVVLPVCFITAWFIQRSLSRHIEMLLRHNSQKQATLIETLTGLETVKCIGAESALQKRWEQSVGTIANLSLKSRLLSSSAVNITIFFQQMSTVAVVIYGVYLIGDGELSVGGLIASTILTGRALAPLGQAAGVLTRINQAKAAYTATDQIMKTPVERPANKTFIERNTIRGDIEFKNVSFSYPEQSIEALDKVSFKIEAGEHIAIIGRIGSGKSTIERLLLGLYEPSAGSLLIDGIDSRQLDPVEVRRSIGYVPQDSFLFYGTVRDNIVFGMPHAEDHAILRAAAVSGVTDFVNRHPSGLEMQVGERGDRLSGGQKQSISVARALLRDPPILVMDEPSNAMDNTTEEIFKSRLREILNNKTLVLVTHRASLLSLVDRVIVMDSSRIIADGPKDTVLAALKQGQIRVPRP
ncbi:MAG TPA: type I secretion system permease/ATPase [Gammaproteobacteria bacterium]|nr:type I secretion system permease/ATPase [Gammaproteobacteria bacterium]